MRIAYMNTDEVNKALAEQMAVACGAVVRTVLPKDPARDGQFDAILYNLDDVPREERSVLLEELRLGRPHGCFTRQFDEDALRVLVEQHGPMVMGLCRRVLRDLHDAEDAFQATFLVLIRRAGDLKERDALGPWLFGVARRTAQRVRSRKIRRDEHERGGAKGDQDQDRDVPREDDPLQGMLDAEAIRALQEEVDRLPAEYRAPILLCDLQGLTRQEAAQRLGCPAGTVGGRVARGRRLLRDRLVRRGFVPATIRQGDRG